MAFIPAVQEGEFGGPNTTHCWGCMAMPFPTTAVVPIGMTQIVTVADGLNTKRLARVRLALATCTLEFETFGVIRGAGLG